MKGTVFYHGVPLYSIFFFLGKSREEMLNVPTSELAFFFDLLVWIKNMYKVL